MEIVSIEELPRQLAASWGAVQWSDHDSPPDRAQFDRVKSAGVPVAEYGGLLAVDRGEVLAQVIVRRTRLTTPHGVESIACLEDVVTRPDALGRGLCSLLLKEFHRREDDAGQTLAMLWTRRTWGAHRLYEKMGYRDVYSPPNALRPPRSGPPPRLPPGFRLRQANRNDLPVLDSLLARATRGRYGFVPRFKGSFLARVRLGWRTAKEFQLLVRRSRPVGFFHAIESRRHVGVFEGVVVQRRLLRALIDSMLHLAKGRWLTLGYTTLVNDAAQFLRARGFSIYPDSHAVLMARSLVGPPRNRLPELLRLVRHPRFSCHRGDMF